ncbi:hypothetical protein O2N63_11130 [Aliiroseovarius sp. KMU-50]|uniref:Uncharacterized protein n=1 Tax=Aliiroseovarius salicola TaxID=3009082 RepID=A0ABT4W4A2_9RHOB|nr:hypothetical protein [Aliiroseovarius sp. KMU-50]MDA5094637.1 hypothetical protein [Aliiroseovarius sp. KMU-50]
MEANMATSFLEKARAGRLAALETLNSPYKNKKPENDIFQFGLDMPETTDRPNIQFTSQREKTQGHCLAA